MAIPDIVKEKPPSKRKLYAQAAQSLQTRPLRHKDFQISMFIKNERMSDPNKAPRCIQSYSPRYNLVFQQYLRPIEKWFKSMGFDTVMTTKGMNQQEQARLLTSQSQRFNDPVYLLADHSRFDSRQHTLWLEEEKKYNIAFHDNDPKFAELYDVQINRKIGTSRNGTKYTVVGTRMSGAPNTSHGNCTTNYAILAYWLNKSLINKYRIIVNGDDSVIIIEREDKHLLNNKLLDELGFATKVEIVEELAQVSFCQTNPIRTINGPLMVRDPLRVLSRDTVCIDRGIKDHDFGHWLHTVGECELSLNPGVPILQSFARFLLRCGSKRVAVSHELTYKASGIKSGRSEITPLARQDFHVAFGITPAQQVFYEQMFDKLELPQSVRRVYHPTPQSKVWMDARI